MHNREHSVDAPMLYPLQRRRAEAVIVVKSQFSGFYFTHFLSTNIKYFVEGIYRKRPTFFYLLAFLAPYPPPPAS